MHFNSIFQLNFSRGVCANYCGAHCRANTPSTSNNIDASVYGNCTKHFTCKSVTRLHSIIFSSLHTQLFSVMQKCLCLWTCRLCAGQSTPQHHALQAVAKKVLVQRDTRVTAYTQGAAAT